MSNAAATQNRDDASMARVGAVLALATALSALFYYKWGASLRAYDGVMATGKLSANPAIFLEGTVKGTLAYLSKIWPALTYGITIGAVVRAAVPPEWIGRALGKRGLRGTVLGAMAGAPLMLCSCCVTPIFTGLHERGARLSSSLAVMLGAPGLNIAALVLTFALLPAKLAVARVVAALVIVLGLPPILARLDPGAGTKASCAVAPEATAPRDFVARFARSFGYLVVVTVPLIVIGVAMGVAVLPYAEHVSHFGVVVGVALVALAAAVVALPTFFEIPLALLLLHAGAPQGAALAVLVAGPIVNLPSLLVLGRETRPRLALALGLGVWAIATIGGIATST